MAAKVALILFGLFIGMILGITGMSLIVISPFFTEAKALGDISNLVVAVGAVFTMGFTLWQHQQQLDRERQQSLAKVQIVGALMQVLPGLNERALRKTPISPPQMQA